MTFARNLAGVAVLAVMASFAVPAVAGAPMVLAQFFEHLDEEPQDLPPADDPALDGLDIPGLEDGFGGTEPHLRPDMKPGVDESAPPESAQDTKNDKLELGEEAPPPPFDPAERPKRLAELYDKLGSAPSAESAEPIMKAIEELWTVSGSDTVDLLMSRAAQFANAAETDLSLSILDAVVDIAPDEAEAWYLRAKVNVLQGKPERALSDLRRALSIDAKHYRAITDLGLVLEQMGAKKEALEAYRRALDVNPFLEDARSGVDALEREVEGQDI